MQYLSIKRVCLVGFLIAVYLVITRTDIYQNTRTQLALLTRKHSSYSNVSVSISSIYPSSHQVIATDVPENTPTVLSLRNVERLPHAKSRNVFYNRLGKCGSRSLLVLGRSVARINKVRYSMSKNFWDEHPNDNQALAEMKKIARFKPPTFYNRHIHYLDFEKYGFKPPIYINMIRDPISRFASHFNYAKFGDAAGKVRNPPKNLSDINTCVLNEEAFCYRPSMTHYYTNYFCGFDSVCNVTSSKDRVTLAKQHIRENYSVIGLTEEFENTVRLLEKIIPEFFKGSLKVWSSLKRSLTRKTKTKTKEVLNEDAIEKLRNSVLFDDYLVYEEAKAVYLKLVEEYGITR